MAEFYSARSWEIPPLPWTNLSPPFSVRDAARGLSDAQRIIANSFLSQKRNIRLLVLFSALLGLLLGALGGVLIVDYNLGREFSQTIQGYGSDWRCKNAGGEIYEQEGGTFCAIRIND